MFSLKVRYLVHPKYILHTVCILLYKFRSVQSTRTCYPGQGWFVRNLTGVPDKSSRGLASRSRYSALILICFIEYIFHFLIPLWVSLGSLQDCHHAQYPLPLSTVIRMRLVIRQSKLPACLAGVQLAHEWKHSLAFMPQDWWNWQIKWTKYVSMGSYQYRKQVNGEFLHTCE